MIATKVVKAKIISPTNRKAALLEREYEGFQSVLHGEGAPLYSADLNGAINIAQRFSSYIGENGAAFGTALNSGIDLRILRL